MRAGTGAATLVVATRDSTDRSKATADFVGDGLGDQEEINAAIRALPKSGGKVLLCEGTYDIRRVPGELGGVIVNRSHVMLAGQGPSTRLIQAAEQETNVIRIIGSGVGHIVIRDLAVDANSAGNPKREGDPKVSHARFEFCGIKAFCARPGQSGEPCHDITIRDTRVVNAAALGIMLEGPNMKVIDNTIGNAWSDAVEILTGPGEIRGNYFEITGPTHVAAGSDRGDSIIMADNIVHVRKGGDLDIGFRSWAGSKRHVIAGNILTVDPEGRCRKAMDIRGTQTVITGNNLHTSDAANRLELTVSAGDAVVTGNVLENVVIVLNDQTGEDRPVIIRNNVMQNCDVRTVQGKLISE